MTTVRRRLTAEQIAAVAARAGFGGAQLVDAVAIALAESGGDTHARSPNGCCHGLWQIHARVHGEQITALWDPDHNAAVAHRISAAGTNWAPWQVWTNGRYLRHRARAQRAVEALHTGGGGGGAGGGLGLSRSIPLPPLPGPIEDLVDAATGALSGAASTATGALSGATGLAGDALSSGLHAAGLDDLPRKALTIGVGLILLWFGGVLVALGLWRLATGQHPARTVLETTSAAATLGALIP